MLWGLFSLGIIIIAVMLAYAVYLLLKLKKQKLAFRKARQARAERLKESILIIAKAMQSGDCNFSEGVIRIKMLLQPLGLDFMRYPAMQNLYNVVMDMPTHDARKALKRNERMRLDLIREKAEDDYQDSIHQELPTLIQEVKAYVIN
ncbi:hypothetical protein A6A19_07510 [Actinobacillus delphinicola]|uniref:Putative coproporphyrinogen III oxidase n=1 Tax=Actinobacillus delphinicola TaxID=51161 RepID=A0A448TUL8_9PAST|nr:DUF2489 domain-containing protein [Actinobacillus delphinicola]MDG6897822.1 hypothetical protein [Actinobacillus delphinicola]VEJ09697.1 putative coproporphyrinogen III oxidase [Actinobacillus delphinicola]